MTLAYAVDIDNLSNCRVVRREPTLLIMEGSGNYRYVIREGKLEPKSRTRPIVWTRTEGQTYYVCTECRHLNRINVVNMLIRGKHLYTVDCEVCCRCGAHSWLALAGWSTRDMRGTMKRRPDACPLCKEKSPAVGGTRYGFRYCSKLACRVYWSPGSLV